MDFCLGSPFPVSYNVHFIYDKHGKQFCLISNSKGRFINCVIPAKLFLSKFVNRGISHKESDSLTFLTNLRGQFHIGSVFEFDIDEKDMRLCIEDNGYLLGELISFGEYGSIYSVTDQASKRTDIVIKIYLGYMGTGKEEEISILASNTEIGPEVFKVWKCKFDRASRIAFGDQQPEDLVVNFMVMKKYDISLNNYILKLAKEVQDQISRIKEIDPGYNPFTPDNLNSLKMQYGLEEQIIHDIIEKLEEMKYLTLQHGDLHSDNIMLSFDKNGKYNRSVVIDFRISLIRNQDYDPLEDISFLINSLSEDLTYDTEWVVIWDLVNGLKSKRSELEKI